MSADDNAPVQAREVEVVARAILDARGFPNSPITPADLSIGMAAHRALAPIREVERQEAAREALMAAADALGSDPNGPAALETFRADDGRMSLRVAPIDQWLRDRADGVTGRTTHDTDHGQQEDT